MSSGGSSNIHHDSEEDDEDDDEFDHEDMEDEDMEDFPDEMFFRSQMAGASMETAFMNSMLQHQLPPGFLQAHHHNLMMEADDDDDEDDDEDPVLTVKCPVCSTVHVEQKDTRSLSSRTHKCSHGATLLFIPADCPVCMEDGTGPPMVALACGHVVCPPDFQRLGGALHTDDDPDDDDHSDDDEDGMCPGCPHCDPQHHTDSDEEDRGRAMEEFLRLEDEDSDLESIDSDGDDDDDDDTDDDTDDDMPPLLPRPQPGNDSHATTQTCHLIKGSQIENYD
jgi:hypothetical protein